MEVPGGTQSAGAGETAKASKPAKAPAIPEAELKAALDKLGSSSLARQLKPIAAAIEGFDFDAALEKLKEV